jgi:hypothetical protein
MRDSVILRAALLVGSVTAIIARSLMIAAPPPGIQRHPRAERLLCFHIFFFGNPATTHL